MVAAYGETESTHDIDAIPIQSKLSFEEIKLYVLQVAEKLDLSPDWINPYFNSFTHALPLDYMQRTQKIFEGKKIRCMVLGPEDLLIMKLMAGRQKDERHSRRLLKRNNIDLLLVEKQLEVLVNRSIPKSKEALDLFDELKSDMELR